MTDDLNAPFDPDWTSPPGDTIRDAAEERGWTQAELAQRLGYSEKHVSQLINGKVPVTTDTAQRLQRVLGSTVQFWLTREANYQRDLARLEAKRKHAEWVPWLERLPVKALMASGALPKLRQDAKNKPKLVEACLSFFGVASPDDWQAHYGASLQHQFRRNRTDDADLGAISAWLRLGEQQAEQATGPTYHRAAFEQALHTLRGLTCEPPEVFASQMRQRLAQAGVVLVLVPSIPKAHVSGVARWLNDRAVIQLSLYGKTNDRFWFTFFHEAAHILLHAGSREARKSVFLDDADAPGTGDPQEQEANTWAGDWLIPPQYAAELAELHGPQAVQAFAQRLGIHPGIVVGRLQHERLIPHSWMNDLKDSLRAVSV